MLGYFIKFDETAVPNNNLTCSIVQAADPINQYNYWSLSDWFLQDIYILCLKMRESCAYLHFLSSSFFRGCFVCTWSYQLQIIFKQIY